MTVLAILSRKGENVLKIIRKKEDRSMRYLPTIKSIERDSLSFDPFGSYTGVTEDIMDKPVQDADDL